MKFRYRCPVSHDAGAIEVGDNWFLEGAMDYPSIACVHCGAPCLVERAT